LQLSAFVTMAYLVANVCVCCCWILATENLSLTISSQENCGWGCDSTEHETSLTQTTPVS